ncbi:MAG: EAL domain-containing protein [Paracoccaceae bacterium]|nr:EAL domain-containing protein [Paracoccaceae bacterium]
MHLKNDAIAGDTTKLLVDALALPAFIVGLDHSVIFTNALADTLLLDSEGNSLLGRSIQSLLSQDKETQCLDEPFFSLTQTATRTVRLNSVGSKSVEFSVSALKDPQGSVFSYLFQWQRPTEQSLQDGSDATGLHRDTKPRHVGKAAEKTGQSSWETRCHIENDWRWQTTILSANHAIWDHDFERDQHFVSETWRQLRGLSQDDPFPKSNEAWLETIHPQDVDHIKNELRRLDSQETDIIDYKFRQKHTLGHWVWFMSSGRVMRRDKSGLPARIIGTDTDITDIKTVELERHRMADRLHIAMEAAGMARWEFDVGANYAYWDDRMLEIFEITDGINIRSSNAWANYIYPDDREATLALAAECLEQGKDIACDYRHMRKDGSIRHIRTRGKYVRDKEHGARYYGVNFDVTRDYERAEELEQARARLEHDSRHDALTGLANRRYLDDVFTRQSQYLDRADLRPAILHFDIDYFKQINDTLGHDAGDATLKHAAEILRKNVPEDALVARVGGDEFVVLLLSAPDPSELEEIAKNIIGDMSQPFFYGSQQCNTGTSIGIAVAEDAEPLDNGLFINADLALYAAKKAGRGRLQFFTREMKTEARRRKNSFDALLAGFDNGEITCHYQPQFDAQTLEMTGLEALVRWESKKFGLIMPDEFLSTAEDMGLVAHFDELVLRKTLHDLEKWEMQGFDIPRISVNVSSHRLNDPTLIKQLKPMGIPEGKIAFELLESAFLDLKNEVIERNLKQIERMGIDVEIDDFGSGHASIVSLLQVAPKRLKIDRFLIEPIVASNRQRDLIKTIIGIGQMLDVQVVAEGVESWEHVKVLQEIGCCYLQGYGLARPMDAEGVSTFMRELVTKNGCLAFG